MQKYIQRSIDFIKKNKLLSVVILIYITVFIISPQKGILAFKNSLFYVKEMIMVMPAIFILTLFINAWVPKELILKNLGEESGFKGGFLSLAFGSLSAGPLYAAFPICKMLLSKGASVANIVVILSSWAVIKVPMLANEARFLGVRFMVMRWILTVISIFIMSFMLSKIVKKKDIPLVKETSEIVAKTASKMETETTPKMEARRISDGFIMVSIKEEYCIGCGICVEMSPEDFEISDKKAILKNKEVENNDKNNDRIKRIKKIINKCPTQAIYLE
jgi:uncharacterized membrane protein YraQ (UPF0718 family)